jgi:protein O-GlcNAc transferase
MLLPHTGTDPVDEWIRLGVQAQTQNKFPEAEQHYRNALRLDPRNATATHNFAILYAQMGNLNEALLTMERALIFDDKNGSLHVNYGLMCLDADRIELAVLHGKVGVDITTSNPAPTSVPKSFARLCLAMILATAGRAPEALTLYQQVLEEEPEHPQAGPNSCFVQTLCFSTAEDLLKQRQKWHKVSAWKGTYRKPKIDHAWPRPLRVGYVGGDFKSHSAAMVFGHVVFHHDEKAVLPYLYSSLPVDPKADLWTKKFMDVAGPRWRDVSQKSDDDLEDMIREDHIDILVDLASHTGGNRLAIFSRRAAPIQITAWGFAHGTGFPEINYFFADPVSVPENERQWYAEKIYDLPSLVTYEPNDGYNFSDKSELPFRTNGYSTFGSSARYEKLSVECLETFAEILRRVPDSVLRLKDHAYRRPYAIRRVMEHMKDIDPSRLHFLIATSHQEHMLAYRASDLQLDPFPHGGGVVALEQLYMGVPLVTLRGTQPGGRNSASVLTCMGKTEWIAETPEQYIDIAVDLTENIKVLREERHTLRQRLLDSPVMLGYREAVEAAYRDIWERDILK